MTMTRKSQCRSLQLCITAYAGKEYVVFLRRNLRHLYGLLETRTSLRELSLVLVGDQRMTELHQRFMQINAPTDVMTFEMEHDSRGRPISGEVVVCVPEARRRAGPSKKAIRRELLLYSLHGMLHLSGFDDRTKRDFDRMHRMEDHLLTQLGVGAIFNPSPGAKGWRPARTYPAGQRPKDSQR